MDILFNRQCSTKDIHEEKIDPAKKTIELREGREIEKRREKTVEMREMIWPGMESRDQRESSEQSRDGKRWMA